jgi:hypothetical protein
VTGLAASAALLLLLLWFKKKKKKKTIEEQSGPEATTTDETLTEAVEFISEYGLSDNVPGSDGSGDNEDLPGDPDQAGYYDSGEMNASEHNPDDEQDDFQVSSGEVD